ncbi:MAG: GCN5-related N-acetyltransferase [Flaviaesturariibacter sp.]|nr:GCN5-related N-acetyltransferase [Flaviaesturariibacter sp.]
MIAVAKKDSKELTDIISIKDYCPVHQSYFERFNRDWIERFFCLEEIDKYVLMRPDAAILFPGGAILMGSLNGEIAGTVALKKVDSYTYEFTKMAVEERFQRRGLAEALSQAAIEKAKTLGANKIILYSHTSLEAAILLYRKLGFSEVALESGLYQRANIKMELILQS